MNCLALTGLACACGMMAKEEVGLLGGRSGAQRGPTPGRVRGACSSHGSAFTCCGQQLVGGLKNTSYQFFMPIL